MKKLFLLLTLMVLSLVAFAADTDMILTKSRSQIKCYIISETDTKVTYILADSNDPTNMVINKSDILKIYHADDAAVPQVAETTTTQSQTTTQPMTSAPTETKKPDIVYLEDGTIMQVYITSANASEVLYHSILDNATTLRSLPTSSIKKINYADGTIKEYSHPVVVSSTITPISNFMPVSRTGQTYICGTQRMRGAQYASFLSNNHCYTALDQFQSGRKVAKAGWVLFGLGLTLDVTGIGLSVASPEGGSIIGSIGGALEIASIPTLIVGYVRQHKSATTYNATCNSPRAYVSLTSSRNGIGVALNF